MIKEFLALYKVYNQELLTLAWLFGCLVLPNILAFLFTRKKDTGNTDGRQRLLITLRNLSVIVFLIASFVIWGPELKTFAFSLAAFAVALVVAFKEVISCAIGGISTSIFRPFTVGDLIEVPSLNVRGRVIDINGFYATLAQTDTQAKYTGKRLSVPLSVLFVSPVTNSSLLTSHEEGYAVYEIMVPTPPDRAYENSQVLAAAAESVYAPIKAKAEAWLSTKKSDILWNLKDHYPQVGFRPVNEKCVELTVMLLVPAGNRDRYSQKVLKSYYQGLEDRKKQNSSHSSSKLSEEIIDRNLSTTVPAVPS